MLADRKTDRIIRVIDKIRDRIEVEERYRKEAFWSTGVLYFPLFYELALALPVVEDIAFDHRASPLGFGWLVWFAIRSLLSGDSVWSHESSFGTKFTILF